MDAPIAGGARGDVKDGLAQVLEMARATQDGAGSSGHWVQSEWDARLARIDLPEFYDTNGLGAPKLTHEQYLRLLQRQQVHLPVQKADLESNLLGEAGSWTHGPTGRTIPFPPCCRGEQCCGMTQRIRNQPRPFILTMVMFEHEYHHLMSNGVPPKASRPCVMCVRYGLADQVVMVRNLLMSGEAQPGHTVLPTDRRIAASLQFYVNLCDQPGGYRKIYMLMSNQSPDDLILEPICMPGRSVLHCIESPLMFSEVTGQKRLMVDQSALIWVPKADPCPSVGQNLLDFCQGASEHSKVTAQNSRLVVPSSSTSAPSSLVSGTISTHLRPQASSSSRH